MQNSITRGGLILALLVLSAFAARPVMAVEAARVATRSFEHASVNGLVLTGMGAALIAFIAVAIAHWRALARAIDYRPRPSRRRFGLRR
jgi:hypothetical protein